MRVAPPLSISSSKGLLGPMRFSHSCPSVICVCYLGMAFSSQKTQLIVDAWDDVRRDEQLELCTGRIRGSAPRELRWGLQVLLYSSRCYAPKVSA